MKDRIQEIMLREQVTKAVAESIAIVPVTEFKNAESVTIDGWIVVDAGSLRKSACCLSSGLW